MRILERESLARSGFKFTSYWPIIMAITPKLYLTVCCNEGFLFFFYWRGLLFLLQRWRGLVVWTNVLLFEVRFDDAWLLWGIDNNDARGCLAWSDKSVCFWKNCGTPHDLEQLVMEIDSLLPCCCHYETRINPNVTLRNKHIILKVMRFLDHSPVYKLRKLINLPRSWALHAIKN